MSSVITLSPSLAALTDEIGSIRAEIKRLEALNEQLTDQLKAAGEAKYQGNRYKSTVSATKETKVTDWKAVAMHFDPSSQLITAHSTKREAGFRALVSPI
jgi:hypothetical protein